METKEIKIECPEGYEVDKEKSTFEKIVFKKAKKSLPKTWEEFYDTYPLNNGETFIDSTCDIKTISPENSNYTTRCYKNSCNLLPDKETAEAMLALCQLIQLRDCYNSGLRPDWTNDDEEKFVLYFYKEEIIFNSTYSSSYILAFRSEELRNLFYRNFKDLIEKAKPLL